jgi:hypothetical protein
MPIEFNKSPSYSLHKRKIFNLNIIKIAIVMRQYKVQARSSFTYFKNLVFIDLIIDVKNVFIACLIQQFNPLLPF